MKKSIKDKDYSGGAILVCNTIKAKYGITARITRIWEFLEVALSIEKFEILDTRLVHPNFESYIVDRFIDWMNGEEVDFSEIQKAILVAGDFTEREKILLRQNDIEDRLWGYSWHYSLQRLIDKQTNIKQ